MKERPILYSPAMVRAKMEGRKTQTRRLINPQPNNPHVFGVSPIVAEGRIGMLSEMNLKWYGYLTTRNPDNYHGIYAATNDDGKRKDMWIHCPYGKAGDRLWGKETFALGQDINQLGEGPFYRSTDPAWDHEKTGLRWRSGRVMPRSASRILDEITQIRAERLQAITPEDVLAEGLSYDMLSDLYAKGYNKVDEKDLYYIEDTESGDSFFSDDYCLECAKKALPEIQGSAPGKYKILCGHRPESDGLRRCEKCGAHLDVSLSDYGCLEEFKNFETYGFGKPLIEDHYAFGRAAETEQETGWRDGKNMPHFRRAAFALLWDTINGESASWESNPWVWVISTKQV